MNKIEKNQLARLLLRRCEGFKVHHGVDLSTTENPRGKRYWRIAEAIDLLLRQQKRRKKK